MKHALILALMVFSACATPAPADKPTAEQCEAVCLACEKAVVRFEERLADHLHCTSDADCIADSIKPVPGYCCYASRRDWWEGAEKRELLDRAGAACGRVDYSCPRHRCRAVCREGRCTSVFDVEPSKSEVAGQ